MSSFYSFIIHNQSLRSFTAGGGGRHRGKIKRGLGTERARLATFRGFGTQRAKLGTFRGFCTERARLGTFRGFGTEGGKLTIVRTVISRRQLRLDPVSQLDTLVVDSGHLSSRHGYFCYF